MTADAEEERLNLERRITLQEETEKTEDEEVMQNPSFTRKVNGFRTGFRRKQLYLCSLCYLL